MSKKAEQVLLFVGLSILTVLSIVLGKRIFKKPSSSNGNNNEVQPEQPLSIKNISKILIVGDSVTVGGTYTGGYVNLIKKLYPDIIITTVAAIGVSTDWMLTNAKTKIKNGNYDLLIIMGGTNDIYSGRLLKDTKANLQAIYDAAKAADTKVMAITPPPSGTYSLWTLSKQAFHEALNKFILTNKSVDYPVDFYTLLLDSSGVGKAKAAYMNSDGLHPNFTAHKLLFNYIINKYFS